MRSKSELIRLFGRRAVRACSITGLGAFLFFLFVNGLPIGMAAIVACACSIIAAAFLMTELVLFVVLGIRSDLVGAIVGACFAALAYVLWRVGFGRPADLLETVVAIISGAAIGMRRASGLRRLERN